MRAGKKLGKRMAWNAMLFCALGGVVSSAAAQQTAPPPALPDSPSATLAKSQPPAFPQTGQQTAQPAPSAPIATQNQTQSSQNQSSQTQSQTAPQQPVGTAAAEPTHAAGVAASQPAGVAIAPAKQRRKRTIVIKTAAIIGAAAAVGTVIALTEATGSKPPGAH